MCSTAEKLREKIPDVEKSLEKSQNELTNMITQENKATNEVVNICCCSHLSHLLLCIGINNVFLVATTLRAVMFVIIFLLSVCTVSLSWS